MSIPNILSIIVCTSLCTVIFIMFSYIAYHLIRAWIYEFRKKELHACVPQHNYPVTKGENKYIIQVYKNSYVKVISKPYNLLIDDKVFKTYEEAINFINEINKK